jgi:hypothetical protein
VSSLHWRCTLATCASDGKLPCNNRPEASSRAQQATFESGNNTNRCFARCCPCASSGCFELVVSSQRRAQDRVCGALGWCNRLSASRCVSCLGTVSPARSLDSPSSHISAHSGAPAPTFTSSSMPHCRRVDVPSVTRPCTLHSSRSALPPQPHAAVAPARCNCKAVY